MCIYSFYQVNSFWQFIFLYSRLHAYLMLPVYVRFFLYIAIDILWQKPLPMLIMLTAESSNHTLLLVFLFIFYPLLLILSDYKLSPAFSNHCVCQLAFFDHYFHQYPPNIMSLLASSGHCRCLYSLIAIITRNEASAMLSPVKGRMSQIKIIEDQPKKLKFVQ